MCAISAVSAYGQGLPDNFWNQESLDAFKKIMDEAKKFDEKTGQPDCEDPEKQKWIEVVERKVQE